MLTLFRQLFGLGLIAKTLDFAVRLTIELGAVGALMSALWLAAAILVFTGHALRVAYTGVIVVGVASFLATNFVVFNQHLYLILSIAVILLLFNEREQPLLLRAQLTIVYGFAAITKLNEAFLSGDSLRATLQNRFLWETLNFGGDAIMQPLANAAVALEVFLAVGLWFSRTRVVAATVGVAFHVGMWILMTADPVSMVRLGVFAGLMLILYLPFFSDGELERAARRLPVPGVENLIERHGASQRR